MNKIIDEINQDDLNDQTTEEQVTEEQFVEKQPIEEQIVEERTVKKTIVSGGIMSNDLFVEFMLNCKIGIYEGCKLKDVKCVGSCVLNCSNNTWYGCNTCTCKRGQVYKYLSRSYQP
jgi:hypothetical protein